MSLSSVGHVRLASCRNVEYDTHDDIGTTELQAGVKGVVSAVPSTEMLQAVASVTVPRTPVTACAQRHTILEANHSLDTSIVMVKTDIVVAIPGGQQSWYSLDISITNSYAKFVPEAAYRFTTHEALHGRREESEPEVYMGEMVDQRGVPCPNVVVCKLVRGDISGLEAEARMHTTSLVKMHGPAVPGFVFYCSGFLPESNVPVAAMFTVYKGRALSGEWLDLPVRSR